MHSEVRSTSTRRAANPRSYYQRGEANRERTFSAPSLYFLSFLLFGFSCSSTRETREGRVLASGEPKDGPLDSSSPDDWFGGTPSPLIDWSSEEPGEPTDIVDSFDFKEGPAKVLGRVEVVGEMKPLLEVEDIVAEFVCKLVLLAALEREE